MRIWNGLRLNDIVIYNNEKYIIKKLYDNENKRVCDLATLQEPDKTLLFGISVYECIKCED